MSEFTPRFNVNYHHEITERACPPTISKDNLNKILAANAAIDLDQFHSEVHFDNCTFDLGVERIDNLWQLIQNEDIDMPQRYATFGTMIHTVQDFYAHSNWIELNEGEDPVPVWDLVIGSLPAAIVSGTFFWGSPKECGPDAPTHTQLNKDSPNKGQGKKTVTSGPNQGKTLFELAFDTALRATRVQFTRLEEVMGLSSGDVP
jgi:hypothetical protein